MRKLLVLFVLLMAGLSIFGYYQAVSNGMTMNARVTMKVENRAYEYDTNLTVTGLKGALILVNGEHPLEATYTPENLVTIYGSVANRPFELARADITMEATALQAFIEMINAAAKAKHNNYIMQSAFRDYEKQAALYENAVPIGDYLDTQKPGCSEHQTGLAVDMTKNETAISGFLETPEGKWILANAADYGFIRRFTEEKSKITGIVDEAWHYRYVGVPHAQIMVSKNWCLEEYIDYLHTNKSITVTVGELGTYEIRYVPEGKPLAGYQNTEISADNAGGYILTSKLEN